MLDTETAPAEPAHELPLFRIVSRWTGIVRFELRCASFRLAVETAARAEIDLRRADLSDADLSGADLSGADLSGADLSGADLSGADLRRADLSRAALSGAALSGADLSGADLSGAVLRDADLRGADLSGAVLRDADLRGADLSGAVLRDADLSGAVLRDADLRGADLSGADLSGAVLRPIRADLYDVLVTARAEAPAFLAALREGRVNGLVYRGECACLVGTIANARGVDVGTLPQDQSRPIERFLLAVKAGDTPETNPVSKLVAEWTAAFVGEGV